MEKRENVEILMNLIEQKAQDRCQNES
jgi:hypothetical protein